MFVKNPSTNNQQNQDKTQQYITQEFIDALIQRGDTSPDSIVEQFAHKYEKEFKWLGEGRQDDILRQAMQETGVDLSKWVDN